MTVEIGVKALAEAVAVDVKALTDGKVDKELGKGLSDANFTQVEKDKLSGVAIEATKNRADSENADKVHTHTVEQVSGLGTAATRNVGTARGDVLPVGAYGIADFPISEPTALEASFNGILWSATALEDAVQCGVMISPLELTSRRFGVGFNISSEEGYLTVNNGTSLSTRKIITSSNISSSIANIPSVPKSVGYTVTAADKGASIDTSAGVTIPASVFTVGDVIVVTNTSTSSISITPAAGVTFRLAGSASTGLRTLAGYGVATFRMVSSNVWFASGAGLS